MFALFLTAQYEGSDLLGVYSTFDLAVEAARAYQLEHRLFGEWLEVQQLQLDASPCHGFDREAVWSSEAE